MLSRIGSLALGLVLVATWGCGDAVKKTPTVAVKGVVTLDGKPLAEGEIYFALPGQPLAMLPVKAGAFSGDAAVGSNRVEVRAYKDGPPLSTDATKTPTKQNVIPDRFSVQSKLAAEVTAGGANDFKFDITSK